jgi:hypothetical protein
MGTFCAFWGVGFPSLPLRQSVYVVPLVGDYLAADVGPKINGRPRQYPQPSLVI